MPLLQMPVEVFGKRKSSKVNEMDKPKVTVIL